jgi:hypothetical protein
MPVETIKCRECGSGEVTEYKPGSYVCAHCDAVFKHLDPTRLTVAHDPVFCTCGNQIAYECGYCGGRICEECDVIQSPYLAAMRRHSLHMLVREPWSREPPARHMCPECEERVQEQLRTATDTGQLCWLDGCFARAAESGKPCQCCGRKCCAWHLAPPARPREQPGDLGDLVWSFDPLDHAHGYGACKAVARTVPIRTWMRVVDDRPGYGRDLNAEQMRMACGGEPIRVRWPQVCWGCITEFVCPGQDELRISVGKKGVYSGRRWRHAVEGGREEARQVAQAIEARWSAQLSNRRALAECAPH